MRFFGKTLGIALAAAVGLGLAAPQAAEACWWLFKRPGAPRAEVPVHGPPGDSLDDWEAAYRQSPRPAPRSCAAIPERTATEPAGGEAQSVFE